MKRLRNLVIGLLVLGSVAQAATYYPSQLIRQRFFDDITGAPLAGGQLFTYAAGTTTPQTTYSNSTGTTNTNPVILDSNGYADVWVDPTLVYKFILEDASSNVEWTADNIGYPLGVSIWSANTSYAAGAIVADSSGYGLFYVSLVNGNVGNSLADVSAWRIYGGNVRTVSTSQTSPALLVTDNLVRSNSTSGNLTHTLPPCSTTPVGTKITVKDVGTGGYTTSLKGSGSDTVDGNNTYAVALSLYQSVTVENNGSSWDTLPPGPITTANIAAGAVTGAKIASQTVGQSNLAARATGTTVAAGGYASSAAIGSTFTTTGGSFVAVTNMSVTITTTGRPVMVGIIPYPGAVEYYVSIGATTSTTGISGFIEILRGATVIAEPILTMSGSSSTLMATSSSQSYLTTDPVAAGTYTYTVQISNGSNTSMAVSNAQLIAYEI